MHPSLVWVDAARFSLCYRLTYSPSLGLMVSNEMDLGPTPSTALKWDHCRGGFIQLAFFILQTVCLWQLAVSCFQQLKSGTWRRHHQPHRGGCHCQCLPLLDSFLNLGSFALRKCCISNNIVLFIFF